MPCSASTTRAIGYAPCPPRPSPFLPCTRLRLTCVHALDRQVIVDLLLSDGGRPGTRRPVSSVPKLATYRCIS